MRIGAACKWMDGDTMTSVPKLNFRVTRVKDLVGLSERDRQAKLYDICVHNMRALLLVLKELRALPEVLRMWRIGSDLLPVATHPIATKFYARQDVQTEIETMLGLVGQIARGYEIRLSFHPGQFVVLGSPNPIARENSVREFEYHAQMAWLMGYRSWHQDGFCINVHVGGKNVDPGVWLKTVRGMSKQARDLITLENDEFCWGAIEILNHFGEHVPLVLDVHHYWLARHRYVKSEGLHIERIIDTWRGVRPKIHLALSFVDLIPVNMRRGVLDLDKLLLTTNKAKLRAHADAPWHLPSLDYWEEFVENFDLMYEGKDKNLGQMVIAHHMGLI